DPTGQKWLDSQAEAWGQQKSSTNNQMPRGLPPQTPRLSPLPSPSTATSLPTNMLPPIGSRPSTPPTGHRLPTPPQAPRLPTLPSPPSAVTSLPDADDGYKQLNPPSTDYEALRHYPPFHPPTRSQSHTEHPQSKRSPRVRPSETSQYASRPSRTPADPTGQKGLDPEAEARGQQKSSTNNNMSRAPPTRTHLPAPPLSQPSQASADPLARYWLNSEAETRGPKTSSTNNKMPNEESVPAECIYPLLLTLEELFKGGKYTYQIPIRLLSGEPKIQEFQIDVEPGWKTGARIEYPDTGNERAPGVFQRTIFVVRQVPHERFSRHGRGNLVYNTDIDLMDARKENRRREVRKVVGVDGKMIEFYPPKGVINPGQEMVIKGEGMYRRSEGNVVGRGDLIIRWNIR
ncbi:hypothetical protein FRC01_007594, partial [Tulasnella sp. 417]